MKRSPAPPTPCSPLSTSSTASASSNSCSTRRCMRSVSASRGRWTPGRSVSTSCHSPGRVRHAADRAARGLRLVGDDRHLLADERVDERRLADVRPAGERDEARAGHFTHETISACRASISPWSVSWSMPTRCSVPWTTASREVLGVLGADHDVAELARRRPPAPSRSTGNERTSVGALDRRGARR